MREITRRTEGRPREVDFAILQSAVTRERLRVDRDTLAPMSDRLAKLFKLLALDEQDTFVLYGIAQEHAKLGDHAQAVMWFDKTLAIDPQYCYAYYHKARSQQAAGDLAAARQTVLAGVQAAHRAGDGKALSELSNLQVELSEQ